MYIRALIFLFYVTIPQRITLCITVFGVLGAWGMVGLDLQPLVKIKNNRPAIKLRFGQKSKRQEIQTQQVDFASVTQRNRYGCLAGIYAKRKNAPNGAFLNWCRLSDLNQRPTDYKSAALPAELNRRACQLYISVKQTQAKNAYVFIMRHFRTVVPAKHFAIF